MMASMEYTVIAFALSGAAIVMAILARRYARIAAERSREAAAIYDSIGRSARTRRVYK
jgi:hypothetical protein